MSEPHDRRLRNRGLNWEPSPGATRLILPRASASSTPALRAPSVEETIRRLAFAPLQPPIPPPNSAPVAAPPPASYPFPLGYSATDRQADGLAAILALPPDRRVRTLNRILEGMPPGQRIRHLREVLGWTQRMIAQRLGIAARTVIRWERGHHRTSRLRLSILRRLRQLEFEHAEEIIRYLSRAGGPI